MNPMFTRLTRLTTLALVVGVAPGCVVYNQPLRDPSYIPPVPPPAPRPDPRQQAATGSIYSPATSRFLFEDFRARRVGDILTILLEEKTAASKKASTEAAKKSSVSMSVPKLFGRSVSAGGAKILDAEVKGDTSFSGEGGSNQSNSLNGNITVHVVQVLPNGNLRVKGEKLLTLNQGSEVIRITGIVRPQDISAKNSIPSYKVADTKIEYKGKGMIADSNRAGWLTRFFHSPLWPY